MIFTRRHVGQPVAGRGRRIDELADAGVAGPLEDTHRALYVGVHVIERLLDRGDDVTDAGEVEHIAGVPEERAPGFELANIAALEGEIGVAGVMGEVALPAADEAVHDADAEPSGEQHVHHVAANEPGAAGDDCDRFHPQTALTAFILRTLK